MAARSELAATRQPDLSIPPGAEVHVGGLDRLPICATYETYGSFGKRSFDRMALPRLTVERDTSQADDVRDGGVPWTVSRQARSDRARLSNLIDGNPVGAGTGIPVIEVEVNAI
jgi:hypothetical protein